MHLSDCPRGIYSTVPVVIAERGGCSRHETNATTARVSRFLPRIGPAELHLRKMVGSGAHYASSMEGPRSSRPEALHKGGPETSDGFQFYRQRRTRSGVATGAAPSLARVVAAHDREFRKPIKWFSIPLFSLRETAAQPAPRTLSIQRRPDRRSIARGRQDWSRSASICCAVLDSAPRTSSFGSATVILDRRGRGKGRRGKMAEILQIIDRAARVARKTAESSARWLSRLRHSRWQRERENSTGLEALRMRGLAEFAQIDSVRAGPLTTPELSSKR